MVAALDVELRWSAGAVLAAERYTPKDFWPTIPMFLRLKAFGISPNITIHGGYGQLKSYYKYIH